MHCRTTFDVIGLCCHYRATYFKCLPSKYQMYCLSLGSIAKIHADGFFKKSIIPQASCFWMLWNEEHGPIVCLEQWGPLQLHHNVLGSSNLEKCHLHLLSLYKASYYHYGPIILIWSYLRFPRFLFSCPYYVNLVTCLPDRYLREISKTVASSE